MYTQFEANQAKRDLSNTLKTKRLTTLQKYNHFRFKKDKITFNQFKINFVSIDNKIKSIYSLKACA